MRLKILFKRHRAIQTLNIIGSQAIINKNIHKIPSAVLNPAQLQPQPRPKHSFNVNNYIQVVKHRNWNIKLLLRIIHIKLCITIFIYNIFHDN